MEVCEGVVVGSDEEISRPIQFVCHWTVLVARAITIRIEWGVFQPIHDWNGRPTRSTSGGMCSKD